jgi:monoamine oxidase
MGALKPTERVRVTVDRLKRFHPEIGGHVDGSFSWFWDEYPWAGAAFSFLGPGDQRSYLKDASDPEGSCHFAGEHCSTEQAFMQGALRSALRAVEEIVSLEH